MAQETIRGPLGLGRGSAFDSGTLARTTSPRPGIIGTTGPLNAKQEAKSLLIAPTQTIKGIIDSIEEMSDAGTGKVRRKKSTIEIFGLTYEIGDDTVFRVNPETKERSYDIELEDEERKGAIQSVHFVRASIANLTVEQAGIRPGNPHSNMILNHLRSILYRLLNAKTPYYSQKLNIDIAMTSKAWKNTCNLTSLAMTLEALGVTATNFTGETDILNRIAEHYGIADPGTLRLPDFLQLVAIYNSPRIKGVNASKLTPRKIVRAQRDAASGAPYKFTLINTLMGFAKLFGVTVTKGRLFKNIENKHPDFDSLTKTKKKNIYKSEAIKSLLGELSKGNQIELALRGHYVRLQDVSESGLIIDDPFTKGNAATVPWQQALNKKYGLVYLILRN